MLLVCLLVGGSVRGQVIQDVPVWTDLEEAMKTPRAIIRLNLSKSKLKSIPPQVFELYNLEELDLSKNQIKTIPPDIAKLKKLRVLNVGKNKLEDLPREIGSLKLLEKLDASRNNLFNLPKEIGGCESLEYLTLWDNNITSLPETLKKVAPLKEIDLRNIVISDPAQSLIRDMLPGVKIHMIDNCHCGPN